MSKNKPSTKNVKKQKSAVSPAGKSLVRPSVKSQGSGSTPGSKTPSPKPAVTPQAKSNFMKQKNRAPVNFKNPAKKKFEKKFEPAKPQSSPVKPGNKPVSGKPSLGAAQTPPKKSVPGPSKGNSPQVAVMSKSTTALVAGSGTSAMLQTVQTAVVASVKKAAVPANLYTEEKMCREPGCENFATSVGYCRLHYIKNWKRIKRKEMIIKEGKLNRYIDELVTKYPDKYIEMIRQDLNTEASFAKVIRDLELDESLDDGEYDNDSIDSLIGSVRKGGSEEFDDGDF